MSGVRAAVSSILIFLFVSASYGVSSKITYQGQLSELGVPVTGTKEMAFRIYSSSIGGAATWSSGAHNVAVANGLFRVLLEPSGFSWEQDLFIEVEVSGVTMSPREELTATAFAINSRLVAGKAYTTAATAPSSPSEGDLWFDTGSNNLSVWSGSAWDQLTNAAPTSITNAHIAANAAIQLSKLEKDPSQAGTINVSTNPVDWTALKSVPAGFSDGVDNTGGGSPVVEEGGAVVDGSASVLNFSAANFDVTSSPAGQANMALDASSVTLQGNSFNQAGGLLQLDVGAKVPNFLLAASSVTLLGNSFNGAGQLLQLDLSAALPALSGANLTGLLPANLAAGSLPSTVMVSSIAANAVQDASIAAVSAGKLVGNISSTLLDTSSITKQGNVFNGVNGLVQLTGGGALPALNAANLTSLTPTNLTAGSLPSNVMISSVAANSVLNEAIVGLSGTKLTDSVPSSLLDTSSVTKQGNIFNAANGLVQLTGGGALPALNAANLTSLTPTNLTAGSLPSNVMISSVAANSVLNEAIVGLSGTKLTDSVPSSLLDTSSITKQGNILNAANGLVQLTGGGALPALNGANLTALNPANLGSGALPATVMVSSIAANAVEAASIVSLPASKLTGGTISDQITILSTLTVTGNSFSVAGSTFSINNGQITIGGGTPIAKHLSATANLNFPAISLGCNSQTISVPGASDGDAVYLGIPQSLAVIDVSLSFFSAYVSDDDEVTVKRCGLGVSFNDPAAAPVRVDVWKH